MYKEIGGLIVPIKSKSNYMYKKFVLIILIRKIYETSKSFTSSIKPKTTATLHYTQK